MSEKMKNFEGKKVMGMVDEEGEMNLEETMKEMKLLGEMKILSEKEEFGVKIVRNEEELRGD